MLQAHFSGVWSKDACRQPQQGCLANTIPTHKSDAIVPENSGTEIVEEASFPITEANVDGWDDLRGLLSTSNKMVRT